MFILYKAQEPLTEGGFYAGGKSKGTVYEDMCKR